MPSKEERVRELADRAKHLATIRDLPSYLILKQILERKIDHEFRRFTSPEPASDQDYQRGFISGLRYVLDVVEGGEKAFEIAMRNVRALSEEANELV